MSDDVATAFVRLKPEQTRQ